MRSTPAPENVCRFAHLRFESTLLAVSWHFACLCGDGCDASSAASRRILEVIGMEFHDERKSTESEECTGCGITAIGSTTDMWCPDCECVHAFCGQCAHDAIEALAA